MQKAFFSFLTMLVFTGSLLAQKSDLIVKSGDKGLYLEHKVAPKESFYAVGRMYNVSPKFLATYNKLDLAKGLQIDQKLRIPLTDTNFTQKGTSGSLVYYKVGENEGLSTVSKKNGGVLLANLRLWNNLNSDELKEGTRLVVGFLTGSTFPVVTLNNIPAPIAVVEEKKVTNSEPEITKKEEEKIAKEEKKGEKEAEKQVAKQPVPLVKETRKLTAEGQGYFKSHYDQQVRISPASKNETVTSGIFKTTSGWEDAKFYLLIDKVQPGTIVKVINPTNNKAVFAKVLGEMSGIRQNQGLDIRISNAAAAALEVKEDDKFIVQVNY
jgi:LysM repeat protein